MVMEHLDPLGLDAVRAGQRNIHAESCTSCSEAVRELRGIEAVLRRASRIAVPEGVDRAVLACIPRRSRWRQGVAVAAAICLAWTVSMSVSLPHRPTIVEAYVVALKGGHGELLANACVETHFLPVHFPFHEAIRFCVVDLYVDSGSTPLGAWQIEVTCGAKIVGIEGETRPPYYDPAALEGGRIVLADYLQGEEAVAGRRRVARLHMMECGDPAYAVKWCAAASVDGKRIVGKAEIEEGR